MLMNRLADHAAGRITLDATQVRAIEVILSKTVPNLTAIEQTTIDTRDAVPEVELLGTLHALITSSPTVIDSLLQAILKHDPGALQRAVDAKAAQEAATLPAPVPAVEVEQHTEH